jgi:hypothetical protein
MTTIEHAITTGGPKTATGTILGLAQCVASSRGPIVMPTAAIKN